VPNLDAPPIRSTAGSFPWSVLHDRHPALIEKVCHGLPYPPEVRRALDRLATEIEGAIQPLPPDAHDAAIWAVWGADYFGERWYDVPFLWAESFFYRKLLDAVGYFEPGPWQAIDPFEPFKSAELPGLADDLAALDATPDDAAVLAASLWGNRADLGFQLSHEVRAGGDLLVDDSARLWPLVTGTVCIVCDNAARELVPDLVLADHLLTSNRATEVVLHVKTYPYFVSDAMTSDVLAAVRRLVAADGRAAEVGRRLWDALAGGTLVVRAHPFSTAPWSYDRMPADLTAEFAAASVTIMKGDLNYRRLVGDRAWQATTSFADVTAYFPGPVVALRTLKSDVIVGLTAADLATLDATGDSWRTNGAHAVIQLRE
jgi:hypothetical protein